MSPLYLKYLKITKQHDLQLDLLGPRLSRFSSRSFRAGKMVPVSQMRTTGGKSSPVVL
jgi:hypothetical protein